METVTWQLGEVEDAGQMYSREAITQGKDAKLWLRVSDARMRLIEQVNLRKDERLEGNVWESFAKATAESFKWLRLITLQCISNNLLTSEGRVPYTKCA